MRVIAGIIGLCIVLIGCVKDQPLQPMTPKQKLITSISVYNVAASIDNMVDHGKSLDARYGALPSEISVVVYPSNRSIEECVFKAYPFFGSIKSITEMKPINTSIALANGGSGVIAGGDAKADSGRQGYVVILQKNPVWNEQ